MTKLRPASVKLRRKCFEFWRYETPHGWRMRCQCGCETEFNPAAEKWEADHEHLHTYDGSDDPPNVRPLLYACHRAISGHDKRHICKGQRQSDSIYGVKRSKGWKPEGVKYDWERRRYVREERE